MSRPRKEKKPGAPAGASTTRRPLNVTECRQVEVPAESLVDALVLLAEAHLSAAPASGATTHHEGQEDSQAAGESQPDASHAVGA